MYCGQVREKGACEPSIEAKGAANLVEGDELRELPGVHEEVVAQVLQVTVQECLLDVESESNDVARILHGIRKGVLESEVVLEQGLLVVRQHEYQRHVEYVLQPLGELEGDGVSQMQAAGARPAAGVQEEGLAALVSGQDLVEVAVAEEEASS